MVLQCVSCGILVGKLYWKNLNKYLWLFILWMAAVAEFLYGPQWGPAQPVAWAALFAAIGQAVVLDPEIMGEPR